MTWRLGLIDCDTSHVVAFTQRFNHLDIAEEHCVAGAEVVAAVPGTSLVSPERIPEYTESLRGYGIEILDSPEELVHRVDAVLVESIDGSVHLERALPVIEAGLPLFVDKPFTTSVEDARRLVDAADRKGVALTSASALRYAPEVQDVIRGQSELGAIMGVDAYSPGSQHDRNPGLFHYGVHAVELMYTLMGTGCQSVRAVSVDGADVVVGHWADGRIGTVRATRDSAYGFGGTVFGTRQVTPVVVEGAAFYRELLKVVVGMLETGTWPLTREELIEPVAFQEAALASSLRDGEEVPLAS